MKTILFAFILSEIIIAAAAQQGSVHDSTRFRIKSGLVLGFNQPVPMNGKVGFTEGLSTDVRLIKKIYFNPQVLISFLPAINPGKKYGTFYEIPLNFLYKPFNWKLKPVLSVGPEYKFALGNKNIKALGWYGDIAVGVEKRLKYFVIEPELRFSYGKMMHTIYLALVIKE
jgi:hypothetical protein